MAEHDASSSPSSFLPRDPIKASVVTSAAHKRRQHAVTIGKERREALIRTKRLCRVGVSGDIGDSLEGSMIIDEEKSTLDTQALQLVESLKSAVYLHGKGAAQKKGEILRDLRRLLSKSDAPPIDAAIHAGAIPVLVQCLHFGTPDEQLLEAAWCLTNIAAGESEATKSLLPALPLLIAHLGEKSSLPVAEQCAWALGNVAGEGEELRSVLLAQGALLPLARLMLSNKSSTARTAAWALSNMIKGPDPKATTELIKVEGVSDAIVRHLKKGDDELATEVAWVVVYLSALSEIAVRLMVKSNIIELLVGRLTASESLPLLIPVLRSLGNIVAADASITDNILRVGKDITDCAVSSLVKCMNNENRVLKKEAAWVISNLAASSVEHKRLIYASEATPLLINFLLSAPFDVRKEAAYALGNLCVAPTETVGHSNIILDHLVSIVHQGCLPGIINLLKSPDMESARLGLQFLELVLRGMPNGEGPKLVEREDGIAAMEIFQFHENEFMRNMANELVDKYFGEDYGLDD
ncbi:Importin subunit alpha protein [Dioscorea alata]|uniref:Importin subunit alpha protein n=3 Tax=Dioscorea alata TaxID=55571 RepID=A0ACB7VFI4_DIOAL|nr:Importin subunit alpha protein [Dioscorea alata]KAH7672623.1 Importin subunit alpha protein [Dioscorea alata]KAH7672624.1 Importin subunit alpha protein [Dioscorea alata]